MSSAPSSGMRLPGSWLEAWTGHDVIWFSGATSFQKREPCSSLRHSTPNPTGLCVTVLKTSSRFLTTSLSKSYFWQISRLQCGSTAIRYHENKVQGAVLPRPSLLCQSPSKLAVLPGRTISSVNTDMSPLNCHIGMSRHLTSAA